MEELLNTAKKIAREASELTTITWKTINTVLIGTAIVMTIEIVTFTVVIPILFDIGWLN